MPADCMPSLLPPGAGPVFEDIAHRVAALASRRKPRQPGIPHDPARPQRPDFAQPDPLAFAHCRRLATILATTLADILGVARNSCNLKSACFAAVKHARKALANS